MVAVQLNGIHCLIRDTLILSESVISATCLYHHLLILNEPSPVHTPCVCVSVSKCHCQCHCTILSLFMYMYMLVPLHVVYIHHFLVCVCVCVCVCMYMVCAHYSRVLLLFVN